MRRHSRLTVRNDRANRACEVVTGVEDVPNPAERLQKKPRCKTGALDLHETDMVRDYGRHSDGMWATLPLPTQVHWIAEATVEGEKVKVTSPPVFCVAIVNAPLPV